MTITMRLLGGPKDGELWADEWPPSALVQVCRAPARTVDPDGRAVLPEFGYYRRVLNTFEIEQGTERFDYVWEGWYRP